MFAFWKRGEVVQELVLKHIAHVQEAMTLFARATRAYFEEKAAETAMQLMYETHKAESRADDVRREVERTMVQGALLAPSRRQLLQLVDRVDSLANAAQGTLHYLLGQSVAVPSGIEPAVLSILDETEALFGEVECGIRSLFAGDSKSVLACAERIDQHESAVDKLETKATRALFDMSIDLAVKLHVHGYIERLVEISDRAEDLADQMALVAAERAF
jgi:predicted phosphate transport protein (TIGR00153 family)